MRKFFILLFFFLICDFAFSQMHVKEGSFRKINGYVMLDKSEHVDDNNVPMALIKISTENISAEQRRKMTFKGNLATYFDVQFQSSEIYLYLSTTATFLEIHHPDYGKTEYWIPENLCEYCGYEMVVVSNYQDGSKNNTPQLTFNYLIITTDQPNSVIYVNDEIVGEQDCSVSLSIGEEYSWRIECPLYHAESGKFTMTAGEPVALEKKLRPAFGYLYINSIPEEGASVYINNQKVGVTPYQSDRLASGDYTVRLMKDTYKPVEQVFSVTDDDITQVQIDMKSDLVNVTITTDPEADIYIDNKFYAKGSWTGNLAEGFHLFEAKKEKYLTTKRSENIKVGEDLNITIDSPKPICGMLDINCSPIKTDIYIDGVLMGQTPKIISNIVIGEHDLTLSKEGYISIKKKITIEDNKILSLKETLKPETKKVEKVDKDKNADVDNLFFAALNFSYSLAPQSSAGITVGQLKKFGWYVSAMTGLGFDAMSTEMECDETGLVDGYLPFYSGDIASSRLSITAGAMYRVAKPIAVKLGAGYGMNILAWKTLDGQCVKNSAYSFSGVDINAGLQLFFGKITASVDFVTTNAQYSEVKIGIGVCF